MVRDTCAASVDAGQLYGKRVWRRFALLVPWTGRKREVTQRDRPRGEIVIVVGPPEPAPVVVEPEHDITEDLDEHDAPEEPHSDVVAQDEQALRRA